MKRMLGMTLVAGLLLVLSSTTQAQTFSTEYYGGDGYAPGACGYADLPFGGYGFEYTQGPPASGIVMNRWGQVVGTTYGAPRPTVEVTQPVVRTTIRSRNRTAPLQPRYAVTTGSLGGWDSNGVVVNSPVMRNRSYGYGYSLSPYGTTQYSGPWKGLTLGY